MSVKDHLSRFHQDLYKNLLRHTSVLKKGHEASRLLSFLLSAIDRQISSTFKEDEEKIGGCN